MLGRQLSTLYGDIPLMSTHMIYIRTWKAWLYMAYTCGLKYAYLCIYLMNIFRLCHEYYIRKWWYILNVIIAQITEWVAMGSCIMRHKWSWRGPCSLISHTLEAAVMWIQLQHGLRCVAYEMEQRPVSQCSQTGTLLLGSCRWPWWVFPVLCAHSLTLCIPNVTIYG